MPANNHQKKENSEQKPKPFESSHAGLTFPIPYFKSKINKSKISKRVGDAVPIYITAIMEYLSAEMIELAGNCSMDHKKRRITATHLKQAIKNDEELSRLVQRTQDTKLDSGFYIPTYEQAANKPVDVDEEKKDKSESQGKWSSASSIKSKQSEDSNSESSEEKVNDDL